MIYGQASSGITGNVKTPVIDLNGFESVIGMVIASATNSSNHLSYRMSTASASGGMSDATGDSSQTSTGVQVLDIYRPIKRFGQFRYSASGATSPAVGLIAMAYGARAMPTTQPTGTSVKRLYSPGSGTASG